MQVWSLVFHPVHSMGPKVNFTPLEKQIILELVESVQDIIESKKNDGRIIEKKDKAWDTVTQQFNARHGVNKRTKKQLKDAWQNLKKIAKKEVAKDKQEKRITGGGQKDGTISTFSQKVADMLPQQILSLHNAYDGDAAYHGDVAQSQVS